MPVMYYLILVVASQEPTSKNFTFPLTTGVNILAAALVDWMSPRLRARASLLLEVLATSVAVLVSPMPDPGWVDGLVDGFGVAEREGKSVNMLGWVRFVMADGPVDPPIRLNM